MILTVTLNPAVDRTYRVDNFAVDQIHRPAEWHASAGGKGINVARVFQALGGEAVSTGFLGGQTGQFIQSSLKREGLRGRFVRTADSTRTCVKIVDPAARTQTEINEPGPCVLHTELAKLRSLVARLIREQAFAYITLSGSVPAGVPSSIYADLIEIAKRAGVRAALDTSGEALRQGVEARPWMIKPNSLELSALLGKHAQSDSDIIGAARELRSRGIEIVCVTRGPASALCAAEDGMWRAYPPALQVVSAVGSGDAFLAAFLWGDANCLPKREVLRLAVSAGSARAAEPHAGEYLASAIGHFADMTRVEDL